MDTFLSPAPMVIMVEDGNRRHNTKPKTKRGIARLKAEKQNMSLFKEYNLPVHF